MLYLALFYVITSVLCLWAGLIFYSIFHRIGNTNFDNTIQRPLICYLLSGLILLTGLGQWIVLAFPLDVSTLAFVIIPLLAILSLHLRKRLTAGLRQLLAGKYFHPLFLPCFGIFLLMILTLNAGPTIMDDTDSYHIQMVKWVQEYGTVPGIANLHLRFGFNSSWFLSIALLIPKIKSINSYLALNGLLSCWLGYYMLQKIFGVFAGGPISGGPIFLLSGSNPSLSGVGSSGRLSSLSGDLPDVNTFYAALFMLILGLVVWPMLRGNAASANYDFISTCCLLILFMEKGFPSSSAGRPEWIVWPFYLGTVKQINFVLLFIYLFFIIRSFRHFKSSILLTYVAAGCFLLIPFFIRNLLLSGYLLYPLYQLDLFSFDWKVSKPLVIELMNYINCFNRSNGESAKVAGLPITGWLPVWHRNLVLYDKILTDLSLLCWLLILARWKKLVRWEKSRYFSREYPPFIAALFLMLLTWLMTAPDPRFIYGVLLAGIFAFLLTLPSLSSVVTCRRLVMGALLVISGTTSIYTVQKMIVHPEYRNWLLPSPLPVPHTRKLMVDNIELQIPDKILDNWNPRCYDLELPCLYLVNPYLRARGNKISDGFRVDKDAPEGENKIRKSL